MLHHASLLASTPVVPLSTVFQAAAAQAWARTRPVRVFHRRAGILQQEAVIQMSPGGVCADSTLRSVVQAASDSFPSTSRIGGLPAPREVDSIVEQELTDHPAPAQDFDVDAEGADRHVLASRRPPRTPKAVRPHPRSCAVIDVDSLSGWDIAFVERGRSVSSPYDSDPPWSEICDEVPWISAFSEQAFTVPSLGTSLPASAAELHENMVHYILSSSSPALLQRMLSYHAAFPTLHSTASFNILIRLAIRMSSYGTVPFLLEKMRLERIPGNSDTRALRVRWMVRTGKWDQAWNDERKVAEDEGVAMPLSVWLEFFEIAKRGTIWRPLQDLDDDPTSHRKRLDSLEDSVAPGRYRVLFMNPPSFTLQERMKIPPRAVYTIVRALIRIDNGQKAVEMTTSYFESLPRDLDDEWRRTCLNIIHLHMAPRRKLNLTSHHSIKRILFAFLGMHPSFQPSPTTLFFLLRGLRSTSKCGDRAGALVGQFVARWGSEIVDDRVRRRYASLLIKQSKLRAAATVDLAQQHVETLREEWRTEKEVRVGERNAERRRHLRWLDMGRTPRRNLEKWCWRLLRRRLWRTWNKGRSTLVDK